MLLKKLPEKLGDHRKFLIPCDFLGMDVCHALADLDASINLLPLFIWKKISLPELTPTRMTLKLADRSITRPKGVAEDVFVKVGKFHFPIDFVVVDFEADPRNQSSTSGTLPSNTIPNPKGEMKEITTWSGVAYEGPSIPTPKKDKLFELAKIPLNENCSAILLKKLPENLGDPGKFLLPCNFLGMDSVNRIDIIDVAREEYAQEILGFSKISSGGNPTSTSEPINSDSSPSLTPFKGSDFILEEIEAYLKDESISSKIDHQGEVVKAKSLIEEPSKLELKDLPSHLEYAYLEDGFSGYFQILINPPDQEMTTFTCPYETFAYRRMPFGLCNAPRTFQRYMMAIFHDMIEKTMEVFMDDFSVFGDSFSSCLSHLDTMLQWCEDTNLVLNWEKCHFMVKEGIVLGHKISKNGLEVDRAKVDVIAKLPHPTTVKGVRSFLGHANFYRRFIQDFSKIARPMTHHLEKETPFVFFKDCIDAFESFKKKLTESLILVVPDWKLPFELMCDASDFVIVAVL
nr:reverse transcriptase domain-containing protein [Tanacetum cinerariifolium]